MKKLLLLAALCFPASAMADMQHSIMSSVKLEALSSATTADKIGSTYSISGNGITTLDSDGNSSIGGFGSTTSGVPSITFPDSATQATNGQESGWSYSTSYLEGDATPTAAITSLGTVQNFSDLTSTSAASINGAEITLDGHTIGMDVGTSSGVVITGQFVTDLVLE